MVTHSKKIRTNGRVIGEVRLDGVFQKRLKGSRHFLRDPRAVAFSVESLEDAKHAGAKVFEVIDVETATVYTIDLAIFERYSFPVNRGYEPQLACRLSHFTVNGVPPVSHARPAVKPKPQAEQLQLFGGQR